MADQRTARTMELSGNAYAKVAERLKLFRQDWPESKTETDHTATDDGSVEFKAWLWKSKVEYMDLVRSGVTDKDVLRSTADSDGDAKGAVGTKQKDFEKLQTIAMGRALANLGYLASGEIASFEEMQEYNKFKEKEQQVEIDKAIELINAATSNDELNKVFPKIGAMLKFDAVVQAGKAKRAELTKAATPEPEKPVREIGGKKVETPNADN